jgi:hypothetical protein
LAVWRAAAAAAGRGGFGEKNSVEFSLLWS